MVLDLTYLDHLLNPLQSLRNESIEVVLRNVAMFQHCKLIETILAIRLLNLSRVKYSNIGDSFLRPPFD